MRQLTRLVQGVSPCIHSSVSPTIVRGGLTQCLFISTGREQRYSQSTIVQPVCYVNLPKHGNGFNRYFGIGSSFITYRKEVPQTDEDVQLMGRGDRVIKVKLATTRLGAVIKAGLQLSRNKIDKAFYEDRIRVNGDRPKKKSQQLNEGDEVDIVRCANKVNPEFIDVSRVEVVTLHEDSIGGHDEYASESDDEKSDSKIPAILKRYKSLTIENYNDPWKGPIDD